MEVRFIKAGEYPQDFTKYKGDSDPQKHLENCKNKWNREGVVGA